jgi:hypothetical protein
MSSPGLGSLIYSFTGYAGLFFCFGSITVLAALIIYIKFENDEPSELSLTKQKTSDPTESVENISILRLFKNSRFALVCGCLSLRNITFSFMEPILAPRLSADFGFSQE